MENHTAFIPLSMEITLIKMQIDHPLMTCYHLLIIRSESSLVVTSKNYNSFVHVSRMLSSNRIYNIMVRYLLASYEYFVLFMCYHIVIMQFYSVFHYVSWVLQNILLS